MESNYHEESINSREEIVDHSDQEHNDLGTGRSYECVFCKRGFNTAQALGGHMNIHRKDRTRNKPNFRKQGEIYTDQRLYQQIPSSSYYSNNQSANNQFSSHDHQPILSYAAYFPPASASSGRCNYHDQNDSIRDHHQASNPLIAGDWRMGLSLGFPPTIVEDLDKNRQAVNQDKDLDLELRLGYDS